MRGCFVLQEELAQGFALARDDAHVSLDLHVAAGPAFRLPEIVNLLEVLLLVLFSVRPRSVLRLLLAAGEGRTVLLVDPDVLAANVDVVA